MSDEIKDNFLPFDFSLKKSSRFFSHVSNLIENKTIVGVGESTHGSEEFEKVLSYLSLGLIKENDFTTVVLAEHNFADTRALNKYVLFGEGNASTALAYARHYPQYLMGSETLRMIKAIRGYNKNRPIHSRIWVLGADIQSPNGSARDALAFSKNAGLQLADETWQTLYDLAFLPTSFYKKYIDTHSLERIHENLRPLYRFLKKQEPDSLSWERSWIRQSASNLRHAINTFYLIYSDKSAESYRDSIMFNNVKWVKSQRPNSKIIISAHNAHLEKHPSHKFSGGTNYTRLGWLLKKHYGAEYYAIALDADQGVFWAGGQRVLSLSNRKRKITSLIAEATSSERGLLDLKSDKWIHDFFNKKYFVNYGVISSTARLMQVENFSTAFDALIYIKRSTAIKPANQLPELYTFGLVANTHPKTIQIGRSEGNIDLSFLCDYQMRSDYLPTEGLYFHLVFFNEDGKVVDFKAGPIEPNRCESNFKVPVGAKTFTLNIRGENIEHMNLATIEVNNKKIDLSTVNLFNREYGQEYEKSGKYVSTLRNESLVISLKQY